MKTDTQIANEIIEEFERHQIGNTKINVSVDEGFVKLTGTVDSYTQKIIAERTAKNIEDVKGILNEIIVVIPFVRRNDAKLAKSLLIGAKWRIRN